MCEKHKRSLVEGWHDNVSAVLFAKQVAETEAEDEVSRILFTLFGHNIIIRH